MTYNLAPIDIDLALMLNPNTFALIHNPETKDHDLIIIKDGKQIDRRPLTAFGLIATNIMDEQGEFVVTVSAKSTGIELFRSNDMTKLMFDGDIITNNHDRTVEEGIKHFEEIAHTTIRIDGNITFVLE